MNTRCTNVLVLCLLIVSSEASAHSRGETWSLIEINGTRASISYTMQASDLFQHLPDVAHSPVFDELWVELTSTQIELSSAGTPCERTSSSFRQTVDLVEAHWELECSSNRNFTLVDNALFKEVPGHIHIARAFINGTERKEKLLTSSDRIWQLTTSAGLLETLQDYLILGIEHIVTGYDHLAFLFAVMLLSPRMMTLLLMITGFTIGHSITLAMAVLGYATANRGAVEALIGFTIALVAAEVVALRHGLRKQLIAVTAFGLVTLVILNHAAQFAVNGPNPLTLVGLLLFSVCYLALSRYDNLQNFINPSLTLLFGMIHGFGFAGLLLEIGLPPPSLIPALVGFNLGVEIGQLGVLTAVVGFVLLLRERVRLPWFATDGVASVLCGLGLFWFVARSL